MLMTSVFLIQVLNNFRNMCSDSVEGLNPVAKRVLGASICFSCMSEITLDLHQQKPRKIEHSVRF